MILIPTSIEKYWNSNLLKFINKGVALNQKQNEINIAKFDKNRRNKLLMCVGQPGCLGSTSAYRTNLSWIRHLLCNIFVPRSGRRDLQRHPPKQKPIWGAGSLSYRQIQRAEMIREHVAL